jgi:hypothetical protein
MKKLYYYPSALTVPNFPVLLDELLEDSSPRDISYLAKCNRAIRFCESNPYGINTICKLCSNNFDIYTRSYNFNSKRVEIIDLNLLDIPIINPAVVKAEDFSTLKTKTYKNINIGYGIISSYVSKFRNIAAKTTNEKLVLRNFVAGAKNVVNLLLAVNNEFNFNTVVFYNGRLHSIRPLLEITKKYHINYRILEVVGGRDGSELKKQVYYNTTPFNRKDFAEYIQNNWEMHTPEQREELSKLFFDYKRKGIPVFDKSYIHKSSHSKNYFEEESLKYIVIFNSSPDERASLGEDWEWSFSGHTDQATIAENIVNSFDDGKYRVIFRVHPNLKGYKGDLEYRLSEIQDSFSNFRLVKSTDKVNSYELLDRADYVLSFGSTIGVEATYWNKVSIVIGKSFYDYLDVSYTVKNIEELNELISMCVKPKGKQDSKRWALFYSSRIYNVFPFKNLIPTNINRDGIAKGLAGISAPDSSQKYYLWLNNTTSRIISQYFTFINNYLV